MHLHTIFAAMYNNRDPFLLQIKSYVKCDMLYFYLSYKAEEKKENKLP